VWFTVTAHLELNHSAILLKLRQDIFIKFPEIQTPILESNALPRTAVPTKLMFILRKQKQTKLIPRNNDCPEKLTVAQLVKKFPVFYSNQKFIITFTSTCHWTLPWAR
jgi:hypothetical protein